MWNDILWRQFGAAIDMLEAALHACPDDLWCDPTHDLRHVQHHTGQLQLMLRQKTAAAPGWIIATSSTLR